LPTVGAGASAGGALRSGLRLFAPGVFMAESVCPCILGRAGWRIGDPSSIRLGGEGRSRWGDPAGRAGPAVALEPRQSRLAVALGRSRSRSRWGDPARGRAGRRPRGAGAMGWSRVALGGGRSRSRWADAAVGWSRVAGGRAGGGRRRGWSRGRSWGAE
jgi:hypothetical protein